MPDLVDDALVRALAQLCADSEGLWEGNRWTLREALRPYLRPNHPALRNNVTTQRAVLDARSLLRVTYRVWLTRPAGFGGKLYRLSVHPPTRRPRSAHTEV